MDTWRAPRCRGPQDRIVTTSAWRVPRLVGDRSVVIFSADFGCRRTRWRGGDWRNEGGHASRTSRTIWRLVVFVSRSEASVV